MHSEYRGILLHSGLVHARTKITVSRTDLRLLPPLFPAPFFDWRSSGGSLTTSTQHVVEYFAPLLGSRHAEVPLGISQITFLLSLQSLFSLILPSHLNIALFFFPLFVSSKINKLISHIFAFTIFAFLFVNS